MSIYDYIKAKEGFHDTVYEDVGGVPTIGYGRTGGSFEPTTMEAENAWLMKRVDSDREYVKDYANKHGYDWSPAQIDALTSFTYNLGRGGLDQLTQGGQRDNALIGQKIQEYNRAAGEVQPGLVTRRNEESAMFTGIQGGVPHETFRGPRRDVPRPQSPVPNPTSEPSFGRAFSDARAAHGGGGGTFEWKGNFYTTDLKEEEPMQYNRGVLSVPGYQRGRRKVVDEAERLRREEARAALSGNTSGGRNVPRGATPVPALDVIQDPYAEPRFFGPAQGHDNDPITGELIDDPSKRFGGVPSAPQEEEPGWWARQFAPLKGSLTRSWEERHPPQAPVYPDQAPAGGATVEGFFPTVAGRPDVPTGQLPMPQWTSPKGEIFDITPEGYLVNPETGAAAHTLDQQLFSAADGKQKSEQTLVALQNQAAQEAAAGNISQETLNAIRDEEIKNNLHTNQLADVQETIQEPIVEQQERLNDEYQDYVEDTQKAGVPALDQESWINTKSPDELLSIDENILANPVAPITETPEASIPVVQEPPQDITPSAVSDEAFVAETVTTPDGGNANVNTTPDGGTSVINEDGSESFFSPEQTAKVEGFLQDFFGLGLDEVKQVAGLYLASRATGASHQGSMIWAGNRILGQADAEAERERTQAEEDLARQEQIDALTAVGYTPEQATAAVVAGWKPTAADVEGTELSGKAYIRGYGQVSMTKRDGQEYVKIDGNEVPVNDPRIAGLVESWDENVHSDKALRTQFSDTADAAWAQANQGAGEGEYVSDKRAGEWASQFKRISRMNGISVADADLTYNAVVEAQKRYAQDYVNWKAGNTNVKPSSPEAYVNNQFFTAFTGIPQSVVAGTDPKNFGAVDSKIRKDMDIKDKNDVGYIEEYDNEWNAAFAAWSNPEVNKDDWIKRANKLGGWSPFLLFVDKTPAERIETLANAS